MIPTRSRVLYSDREFDEALQQDNKRRESAERNWDMYSGFDYGQWSKKSVSELRSSNRHVAQYNFIRGKIDGLAGSIVKNWYDIDFVPVEGETSDITKLLKGMFYSDKELLDWDTEYLNIVVDGLIHRGVEQMVIDETYSPLGNIGFERIMPGHIILDPNWKTHNSKDLKKAWKVGYYTPDELKVMFPKKIPRIDEMVWQLANSGMDYGTDITSQSIPRFDLEKEYGSKQRVIECHYIKETSKTIEIAIDQNTGEQVELPQGTHEEKLDFVIRNSILVDGETIKRNYVDKEYWVKTFASQLDDTEYLQDKKSEIQIGRLPFFPWSSARINGVDSGVVDLLIDAQQSINKRESLSDHMISTGAHGGKLFDPSLFGQDAAKVADFKKNINKPDAIFETAPGALQRGANALVTEVPRNQYSGEIYQELQRMSGYMDVLSKQTATMEGRSESSHDTGILFARRQLQSEIALTSLTKTLQQHWNNKGEAYMLLAQQLYTGAYREFRTDYGNGEGKAVTLSVNIPNAEEGGREQLNSLRNMPRHKVVISQSPQGLTIRATERSINAELLQSIPPELATYRAQITQNIMKTLDMSAEDRQRLVELGDLEMAAAIERVRTEIVINKTQQAQAQQQVQSQQQQMSGEQQQQQMAQQEAQAQQEQQ